MAVLWAHSYLASDDQHVSNKCLRLPQLWRASVVLRTMRRIAISTIPTLALLLVTASPSATRDRHTTAMRCSPEHSHVMTADAQAQIYESPASSRYPEFLDAYGCAYGQKHSYLLGPVPYGSPSGA